MSVFSASAPFPSIDVLQTIILHALDKAPISDSRDLVLSLPASEGVLAAGVAGVKVGGGADEQTQIKAVLDRCVGREVRSFLSAPRAPS
jgi:hypothetical protein